jgi:hypothetical protein
LPAKKPEPDSDDAAATADMIVNAATWGEQRMVQYAMDCWAEDFGDLRPVVEALARLVVELKDMADP